MSKLCPQSEQSQPYHSVIAVIGCDGSGKSTLSRWLVEELGKQNQTRFIYFGTGDGPGSLLRRSLNWLKTKSRYGKRPVTQDPSASRSAPSTTDKAPNILRLIWAATVLSERQSKMRALKRMSAAHMTVVTDRYPQAEFSGIHDGPRLGYLITTRTNGLLHSIAQWEQAAYLRIAQRKPDLVLLLDVSAELAHKRRPEESLAELRRRIDVARSLTFQGAHRVVIDASQPLLTVKEEALRAAMEATTVNSS